MNGVIEQEGAIEICINGVWGSICLDGWEDVDAYITCKQLGYADPGLLHTFTCDIFPPVFGPALFKTCMYRFNSIYSVLRVGHIEPHHLL